jgi:hypothetical protein
MGYELGGQPSGRRPGIAGSLTTAVTGRDVQLLVSGQSSEQIPPGRRRLAPRFWYPRGRRLVGLALTGLRAGRADHRILR